MNLTRSPFRFLLQLHPPSVLPLTLLVHFLPTQASIETLTDEIENPPLPPSSLLPTPSLALESNINSQPLPNGPSPSPPPQLPSSPAPTNTSLQVPTQHLVHAQPSSQLDRHPPSRRLQATVEQLVTPISTPWKPNEPSCELRSPRMATG